VAREEHDARSDLARTLQRRWGCPRAKHAPPARLAPDLADEARFVAETTGAPSCGSCPFSRDPSPWAREVLRAQRLAARLNGAVPVREVLGRAPHCWDLAALDAILLAQADADASDSQIAEAERAAKQRL
jgi:hypothetical protein